MSERKSRKSWVALVGGAVAMTVVVTVLLLSVFLPTVAATTPAPGSNLLTVTCTVGTTVTQTYPAPPASDNAKLVLHIRWTAINDEDSGLSGYWALDSYSVNLYVWHIQSGPLTGAFEYIQLFSGIWSTPQGAGSPQHNYTENATQTGALSGALLGWFNGTTTFGSGSLTGVSLGTINYTGTTQDLLNRTYTGTGDKSSFSWTTDVAPGASATYFNINGGGSGVSTSEWGFTYNTKTSYSYDYDSTQWCNLDSEDVGDITTH
jgi:hypothetical protein